MKKTTEPNNLYTDGVPLADPFDGPLNLPRGEAEDRQIILDDTCFAATRQAIQIDGMLFAFIDMPYMPIDSQDKLKRKLLEVSSQGEILVIHGPSGSGKTTVLCQFRDKYPAYVHLHSDFANLSKLEQLVWMGKCVGIPLIHKNSEIERLEEHLLRWQSAVFVFDEANATTLQALRKLDDLRKINSKTHTPIIICGTEKLYNDITDEHNREVTCSLITRMDSFKMTGMTRKNAEDYLRMVSKEECVRFTYGAEQKLIDLATDYSVGAIRCFTTVIGRSLTIARVNYYKEPGRGFPDNSRCLRRRVPDGTSYPGPDLILTLPTTPEQVVIDEMLVRRTLSDYKSMFPSVPAKKKTR